MGNFSAPIKTPRVNTKGPSLGPFVFGNKKNHLYSWSTLTHTQGSKSDNAVLFSLEPMEGLVLKNKCEIRWSKPCRLMVYPKQQTRKLGYCQVDDCLQSFEEERRQSLFIITAEKKAWHNRPQQCICAWYQIRDVRAWINGDLSFLLHTT